jgi:methionyl-tRNA formyltransferase
MRPDDSEPGQVLGVCDGRLEIACGDRVYRVARLTPQGKKSMDAEAFACGYLGRCHQARACS